MCGFPEEKVKSFSEHQLNDIIEATVATLLNEFSDPAVDGLVLDESHARYIAGCIAERL
jgi:hypothetical protein